MSNAIDGPVLVIGATGTQGGGGVKVLLRGGRPVRAIVRDISTAAAQHLAAQGVELLRGDFDDLSSLETALAGAVGVFSMQMPPSPNDLNREVRTGLALVDTAYRAGVGMFVDTLVAGAGDQATIAAESFACFE